MTYSSSRFGQRPQPRDWFSKVPHTRDADGPFVRLSLAARGLFALLWSQEPGWLADQTKGDLIAMSTDGERQFDSAMKELIELGLVTKTEGRDRRGVKTVHYTAEIPTRETRVGEPCRESRQKYAANRGKSMPRNAPLIEEQEEEHLEEIADSSSLRSDQLLFPDDSSVGSIKPPSKPAEKQRVKTPRDLLFDALVAVSAGDASMVTKLGASAIGKAAAEIFAVGGRAEDVPGAVNRYRKKFPGIAVTAMGVAKYWHEICVPVSSGQVVSSRTTERLSDEHGNPIRPPRPPMPRPPSARATPQR